MSVQQLPNFLSGEMISILKPSQSAKESLPSCLYFAITGLFRYSLPVRTLNFCDFFVCVYASRQWRDAYLNTEGALKTSLILTLDLVSQ